jgi:hypothetical protein
VCVRERARAFVCGSAGARACLRLRAPVCAHACVCLQVEELLSWGADAQTCDRMGYSAYGMALKSKCQATIALLADVHLGSRSVAACAIVHVFVCVCRLL